MRPEHPREAQRLILELAARNPWATAPFGPESDDPDPALSEAMVALGYAQSGPEPVDPEWGWTCPTRESAEVLLEEGPCAHCGYRRVLVARRF